MHPFYALVFVILPYPYDWIEKKNGGKKIFMIWLKEKIKRKVGKKEIWGKKNSIFSNQNFSYFIFLNFLSFIFFHLIQTKG